MYIHTNIYRIYISIYFLVLSLLHITLEMLKKDKSEFNVDLLIMFRNFLVLRYMIKTYTRGKQYMYKTTEYV